MKLIHSVRRFCVIILTLTISPLLLASQYTYKGLPVSQITPEEMVQVRAAFAAAETGKGAAARDIFTQVINQNPKLPIAVIGMMQVANSAEEFDQLVNTAAKLENLSDAEKLLVEINKTYISNDTEKRLQLTETLVEQYPNSSLAWSNRASTLVAAKEIAKARLAYDKAMKVNGADVAAHQKAAANYVFFEPKDFVKAEEIALAATKVNPANAATFITLGDVKRAQQDLNAALKHYTLAGTIMPESATAHTKRGHANTFLGNFKDARVDYTVAQKVGAPTDTVWLGNYKAYTHIYEGKPEKSFKELASWVKDIDKMPVDDATKTQAKIFTLTNMAALSVHTKMIDEAKETLKKREALINQQIASINNDTFTRNQRAYNQYWNGFLQLQTGDVASATNSADKLRALMTPIKSPRKFEQYHRLMGQISMVKEQWSNAVAHFDNANQNEIFVKFQKALALEQLGERKKSQALFVEVRDYNFNEIEYALIRGEATQKVMNVGVALTALNP